MRMQWIRGHKGSWVAAAALAALAVAVGPVSAAPPAASAPRTAAAVSVDLNTASVTELVEVPGIGQATAERIVAWREQNGAFHSVEDLLKVKGIGEKSIEKLRPYVKVQKAK